MERSDLVKTLEQLHAELSRADRVDAESLELLRKLIDDIGRLVDRTEEASAEDAEGVTSGLKDLLLKFEVEHPQLAITLGKVADGLAALGI